VSAREKSEAGGGISQPRPGHRPLQFSLRRASRPMRATRQRPRLVQVPTLALVPVPCTVENDPPVCFPGQLQKKKLTRKYIPHRTVTCQCSDRPAWPGALAVAVAVAVVAARRSASGSGSGSHGGRGSGSGSGRRPPPVSDGPQARRLGAELQQGDLQGTVTVIIIMSHTSESIWRSNSIRKSQPQSRPLTSRRNLRTSAGAPS
jgi:hypothetical protein